MEIEEQYTIQIGFDTSRMTDLIDHLTSGLADQSLYENDRQFVLDQLSQKLSTLHFSDYLDLSWADVKEDDSGYPINELSVAQKFFQSESTLSAVFDDDVLCVSSLGTFENYTMVCRHGLITIKNVKFCYMVPGFFNSGVKAAKRVIDIFDCLTKERTDAQ